MHRPRDLIWGLALFAAAAACKEPAPTARAQAALAPGDELWAASGLIRVVDMGAGQVRQKVEIHRPITSMVFTAGGKVAWAGTSHGLYRVDAETGAVRGPLTDRPIRRLELDGDHLALLQHQVIVHADQTREVLPFERLRFDPVAEVIVDREELGQRIHYATRHGATLLLVTEEGRIHLSGRELDLRALVRGAGPFRTRGDVSAKDGATVIVPVEGSPAHLILVDLGSGEARALDLGRPLSIRGLAFVPGGGAVLVNAMREALLVDLATGQPTEPLPLPGAHAGAAISADGRRAYLMQTVDGTGGALTALTLSPLAITARVHLDDISPWALALRPPPRP